MVGPGEQDRRLARAAAIAFALCVCLPGLLLGAGSVVAEEPTTGDIEVTRQWQSQCVTISTGENDGALDCAASVFPKAPRHSSAREAFENVKRCLEGEKGAPNTKDAIVIGHGVGPGIMCAGQGQNCGPNEKNGFSFKHLISFIAPDEWRPAGAALKGKLGDVRLAGCGVGRPEHGLVLLQGVADATEAQALAPSRIISCNVDAKSLVGVDDSWERRGPSGGAQEALAQNGETPDQMAKLIFNGVQVEIPRERLSIVTVDLLMPKSQNLDASVLSIQDVDWFRPIITSSLLLAAETGAVEVRITSPDGPQVKRYRVLASTYLQDTDAPDHYYALGARAVSRLVAAMESAFKN